MIAKILLINIKYEIEIERERESEEKQRRISVLPALSVYRKTIFY